MTAQKANDRCQAWREHWAEDEYPVRCSKRARPGKVFCAHHVWLEPYVVTITWRKRP
jgi:hypothetical protein